MVQKIKQNASVFIFFSLVIILTLMIIDSISIPVYSQRIVCGTRECICMCVDYQGTCYCDVIRNVSCYCWCNNSDNDYCYCGF